MGREKRSLSLKYKLPRHSCACSAEKLPPCFLSCRRGKGCFLRFDEALQDSASLRAHRRDAQCRSGALIYVVIQPSHQRARFPVS